MIRLYSGSGAQDVELLSPTMDQAEWQKLKSTSTIQQIAEKMDLEVDATRKIVKRGIKHLLRMIRAMKKKKKHTR